MIAPVQRPKIHFLVIQIDRHRTGNLLTIVHLAKSSFQTSQFFLTCFFTQLVQSLFNLVERFFHLLLGLLLIVLSLICVAIVQIFSGLLHRFAGGFHLLLPRRLLRSRFLTLIAFLFRLWGVVHFLDQLHRLITCPALFVCKVFECFRWQRFDPPLLFFQFVASFFKIIQSILLILGGLFGAATPQFFFCGTLLLSRFFECFLAGLRLVTGASAASRLPLFGFAFARLTASFTGLTFTGLTFTGLTFTGLRFTLSGFTWFAFFGLTFFGLTFFGLTLTRLAFAGTAVFGIAFPGLTFAPFAFTRLLFVRVPFATFPRRIGHVFGKLFGLFSNFELFVSNLVQRSQTRIGLFFCLIDRVLLSLN